MLTTFLRIALRNIIRNKTFSLINIIGLSIGLVSFLGISLYVIDELSYDRFHKNSDRIYRAIISKTDSDGQISKWGAVPNKLAPTAAKEIPEVEKVFITTSEILGLYQRKQKNFLKRNSSMPIPEFSMCLPFRW
jgi:putative ABC transport system permease protein